MRKIIYLVVFLGIQISAFSQSQDRPYYAIHAGVGIYNATLKSSSTSTLANTQQNYSQYADSVRSMNAFSYNFTAGIYYHKPLGFNWQLQTGVTYAQVGYRKEQNNLKFGDATYPGIGSGIIEDNSNATKDIYYDYRFNTIQIPVIFNYQAYKSKDYKTTLQFSVGAVPQFILNNVLVARLKNFTVDAEDKFKLDSSGYENTAISVSACAGVRLEHKLEKTVTIALQPMFNYYPFSITSNEIKVNPYGFVINASLIFRFEDLKAKPAKQ